MELFDAAFVSVWNEMYGSGGYELAHVEPVPLVEYMEAALRNPTLPPPILNKLLNLVEFMDLHDRTLPVGE